MLVHRRAYLVVVGEDVLAARVPGGAGCQLDREGDAAVRRVGRCVAVERVEREASVEVAVGVGGVQLAALLVPFGVDVTAPHELVVLDLEEVGEVGAQRDLEMEPDGVEAVVGEIEILVDAFVDDSRDGQRERALGDVTVLGGDGPVREVHAHRVVRGRARRQRRPRLTVGRDGVVADETGVIREHAELALAGDLAGQVGHHEGAALVDGEHGGTDADLYRRRLLTIVVGSPVRDGRWVHVSG